MIITNELVAEVGGGDELITFVQCFSDGVNVSKELCISYANVFDWDKAACLLTTEKENYQEASRAAFSMYYDATTFIRLAHNKKVAVIRAMYDELLRPAKDALIKVGELTKEETYAEEISGARKLFNAVKKPLLEVLQEAIEPENKRMKIMSAPANQIYNSAKAAAFADAWEKEHLPDALLGAGGKR